MGEGGDMRYTFGQSEIWLRHGETDGRASEIDNIDFLGARYVCSSFRAMHGLK